MANQHTRKRFEWLIVVSAIGLVVLVGISRYIDLAREGRRLGFELLAHNFTTAVAMTRAQWLIKNPDEKQESFLDLGDKIIYFNAEGWPVAVNLLSDVTPVDDGDFIQQCYQLWQVMLQNPEPATLEGKDLWGQRRYHISTGGKGVCRYELVTKEPKSHFFDYFLYNGQVLITVPVQNSVSSL